MQARRGFTILELVVVMAIGGFLMLIGQNAFTAAQHRMALRSAQSGFETLHAQSRVHAVERGALVRLEVDSDLNQVSIVTGVGADQELLQNVDFLASFSVEIDAPGSPLRLCMNPRGIGETACNSFSSGTDVTFSRAGEIRSVRLLPLGQLVR